MPESRTFRERMATLNNRSLPIWVVIAAVALVILAFLVGSYSAGGWRAEDNVHTWCDSPTGNRMYVFPNGGGDVVPPESRGNKCVPYEAP